MASCSTASPSGLDWASSTAGCPRAAVQLFRGPDPFSSSDFVGYISLVVGVVIMYLALSGLVLKGTQSSPLLALLGIAVTGYGVYQLQRAKTRSG